MLCVCPLKYDIVLLVEVDYGFIFLWFIGVKVCFCSLLRRKNTFMNSKYTKQYFFFYNELSVSNGTAKARSAFNRKVQIQIPLNIIFIYIFPILYVISGMKNSSSSLNFFY